MNAEFALEFGLLRYAAFQAGTPIEGMIFARGFLGAVQAVFREAALRVGGRWKRALGRQSDA